MSSGGLSGGGWEFTKENILPLSSGRRMAHLEESLPATTATGLEDHQHYEAHHLQEIKKLEDIAQNGQVEDPLEAWVTVVNYMEQHFPNMSPAIKKKHGKLLRAIVKHFYTYLHYRNDSRFVKVLISSVKTDAADHQIKCLRNFLEHGKGDLVSGIYMRIAELLNSLEDKKSAMDTLKIGIEKVTDQKHKMELEEMLSCYQHQWAEDFAKKMKYSETSSGEDQHLSGARSFATSVPAMGENNEAVSIRQHLFPAAPIQGTKSSAPTIRSNKPQQQSHSIYTGENSSDSASSAVENGFTFRKPQLPPSFERAVKDNENQLEACRWNSADTNLDNPVLPEPPAKLKLFEDKDLDNQPSASSSKVNNPPVDKRVLQERKESEENPSPSSSQSGSESLNSSTSTIKAQESAQGAPESSDIPVEEECNIFEIKYKTLPANRISNYLVLKVKKWKVQRQELEKQKELENDEKEKMRRTITQLENSNETLSKQLQNLQELHKKAELKLFEKDEKITNLEAQNEQLMHQLTHASTTNNVKESQFLREKMQLGCEMEDLRRILEEERQQHSEEIKSLKNKLEALAASSAESSTTSATRSGRLESQNFGGSGGKSCVVDVDVRSRTDGYSTSSPSVSASADQGSSETSRFHSGDTTKVEQQNQTNNQSVAASSFMPDLDMDSDKSLYADVVPQSQPRRALGMVERPLDNDMMNMTPVTAPPMDFEIPRPQCFGSFGMGVKPKGFSLYQSFSDSTSGQQQKSRTTRGIFGGNKRPDDVMKVIQSLPENMPPPPPEPEFEPEPMAIENQREEEHVVSRTLTMQVGGFRDLRSSRMKTLRFVAQKISHTLPKVNQRFPDQGDHRDLRRDEPSDDEDEDEEEVILRRHQQTGMDLNVSNLTTYLNMCPKPLTNSTPEKERTLRNINAALGRNSESQETEDAPVSDTRAARARFSIMAEPPLNLSIIQETSHENRSRSTTGSSSGNTMFGATRLGMATSSTQLFGGSNNAMARSSSMPRSASRISQQSNMNTNGYYSDTNANV